MLKNARVEEKKGAVHFFATTLKHFWSEHISEHPLQKNEWHPEKNRGRRRKVQSSQGERHPQGDIRPLTRGGVYREGAREVQGHARDPAQLPAAPASTRSDALVGGYRP